MASPSLANSRRVGSAPRTAGSRRRRSIIAFTTRFTCPAMAKNSSVPSAASGYAPMALAAWCINGKACPVLPAKAATRVPPREQHDLWTIVPYIAVTGQPAVRGYPEFVRVFAFAEPGHTDRHVGRWWQRATTSSSARRASTHAGAVRGGALRLAAKHSGRSGGAVGSGERWCSCWRNGSDVLRGTGVDPAFSTASRAAIPSGNLAKPASARRMPPGCLATETAR